MKYREPKKSEIVADLKKLRIELSNLERENIGLREEISKWQMMVGGVLASATIAIVFLALRGS